jgi:hypothetical protein
MKPSEWIWTGVCRIVGFLASAFSSSAPPLLPFPACVATTSTHFTCCDCVRSASPSSVHLSHSTWSICLQFTPWNQVSTTQHTHILSPTSSALDPASSNTTFTAADTVTRSSHRATRTRSGHRQSLQHTGQRQLFVTDDLVGKARRQAAPIFLSQDHVETRSSTQLD